MLPGRRAGSAGEAQGSPAERVEPKLGSRGEKQPQLHYVQLCPHHHRQRHNR